MALTDAKKAEIIYQLCYSGKTLVVDSTSYNKIIADRLENLTSYIEAQVLDLLTCIADVKTKLKKSTCRMSTTQIGDIHLNPDEHRMLKLELKRLLNELSSLLDIPSQCKGGNGSIGLCV